MPRNPLKCSDYGVYVKLTGEALKREKLRNPKSDGFEIAMYIQCKTDKVANKCVDDFIRSGRLAGGKEYMVRRLSA